MHQLHPERWGELEPEFELAELFQAAIDLIEQAPLRTSGLSRAHHFAFHGLQSLHSCTRDPEAKAEFFARKDGTFKGSSAPSAAPSPDVQRQIKAMAAQIEALQAQLATKPTEPAKPADPAKPAEPKPK